MGIRLDGTTDTISAPGSDLNLGQSGDSVKLASQVQLPTHGALSNRNLVVNGAFQVDQRNSGSSLTVSSSGNKFAADRGKFLNLGTGELVLTIQQVTDAPAGFRYSNKATITTAESSGATPAANDRVSMQMRLEGNTVESLALGTSDAEDFVVSFYVKSSLTGNFGVAFTGSNRCYPVLYNIASANTWERKVIKVPGPTDGTWNTGSSEGFAIKFGLYNGSDRDGPDQGTDGTGTWQTNAAAQGTENQVQIGGTVNATWQITGVQLEVGSQATPFEHRSYADELARCQRYFYAYELLGVSLVGGNTALCNGSVYFPVEMRAAPTLTSSSVDRLTNIGEANHNGTYTFGSNIVEKTHCTINYSRSSGDTWNQGTPLSINDTGGSTIMNVTAEL